MNRQENEKEDHLAPADSQIIAALKSSPEGLRFGEIRKKVKLDENNSINHTYLRKRLFYLRMVGYVVRKIRKKQQSIDVIYKLTKNRPTQKDMELGELALARFGNLNSMYSVTARLEAHRFLSKFPSEEQVFKERMLETEYSRFYGHYLWCIYHASQADSNHMRMIIIKLYLFWLKNRIRERMLAPHEKNFAFFKELNDAALPALIKERKLQLSQARKQLVDAFPKNLQNLAGNVFDFWDSSEGESGILETLDDILANRIKMEQFKHFCKKTISRFEVEKARQKLSEVYSQKDM